MNLLPKLPPQDLSAERAVLGACLLDPVGAMAVAQTKLTSADFYRGQHQLIFEAMLRLIEQNEPIDQLTLTNCLQAGGTLQQAGGSSYLAELGFEVATASNISWHCDMVRDRAARRRLNHVCHDIQTGCHDLTRPLSELIGKIEAEAYQIACGQSTKEARPIGALVDESLAELDRLAQSPAKLTGITTGLIDLDRLTNGLHEGDLIVLAGRPSMGKTALALGMARDAERSGKQVLIASLEMSEGQLTQRLLSMGGLVNLQAIRSGQVTPAERGRLREEAQRLRQAKLWIDDSGLTLQQLRGKAKRLKLHRGLDLIVVDYLQLIVGADSAESRQQEIAEISRSLKLLARELKIPVVVLSQLNRSCEARNDKRPLLSDLRESGAIEQDADLVMFVYRDEVYDRDSAKKGRAELLIRKHRNGPVGDLELAFDERMARFGNLSFDGSYR